ncbi:hydrolase [Campylobacter sp. MIT 12-8780]|uniref:HAD family hydrolase n=1 Tax=unclassified Campylobacter TaxID=2593542 RepID=UPI00115CDEBD|nr:MULTISPECIES: HAD family hydrolase [unclassified Campylobacter]NDJ27787.1 HAD family hydrolase [Campylobacter sp. MIT 19-121]TQR41009.1 hydrolase [Campylobacter sp. MIT 12-8780]
MQKTILFDLDGTLIDSTSAILHGFHKSFEYFKYDFHDDEAIKNMIGLPLDEIFKNLGIKVEDTQKYIQVYKNAYKEVYLEQTTLLEKAKEALELAFSFADLAVVTTKSSVFSQILLKHLGVGHFFKVIVGRDDVIKPKPDAEPILKALNLLCKEKTNAFMLGDTHLDIQAAKNAQIGCIALSCGYESKESLLAQKVMVKENAYEAVKYLEKL